MKKKLISLVIILAALASSPCLYAEAGEYPADDEWFSIAVEQYGRPVEIRKNRVKIDRAPFTLVLILRGPSGVLVNFSAVPELYRGFQKNMPLSKITVEPDLFMGIGEEMGNPDELMLIDEISPHFLFYTDSSANRFSSVELRNGYIIGRRVISNYTTYADDFEPIPVEQLAADDIYMSLMYSEWDDNYNRVELQKEGLRITFRD